MKHDPRTYLHDIMRACADIQIFVKGMDFDEYGQNELVRAAVERKFLLIGEAMIRLLRENPEAAAQISHARKIIGFRNILAHGYDLISDETVCSAIQDHVPVLLRETALVALSLDAGDN